MLDYFSSFWSSDRKLPIHIGRNCPLNFFDEFSHRREQFEFYILYLLLQVTKQSKVRRCYVRALWQVRRNSKPAPVEKLSISFWKVMTSIFHMDDPLRMFPNPSVMSTFLSKRCQHLLSEARRIRRVASFYPLYNSRYVQIQSIVSIAFSNWTIIRALVETSSAEEAYVKSVCSDSWLALIPG
jgi:hypothetical protein